MMKERHCYNDDALTPINSLQDLMIDFHIVPINRKTVHTRSDMRKITLAAKIDEVINELYRLIRIFKKTKIVTRKQLKQFKRRRENMILTRSGLSERRIEMFTHFKSDSFMLGDICAICRDNFKLGKHLVKLDCNHVFCNNCTNSWLGNNNTCPSCRDFF